MTLKTRQPTGAVPWPLVLIEGGEKTGKSYSSALLSASDKVGRTLWLDLNEGAADEYGAVPGARYEVIEHDGSWANILGQVEDAKAEALLAHEHGSKPLVLIVDSMTAEWDLLKDWASARARTSASNRKRLQNDPAAEIQVPMNLWNDAGARHRKLMTLLMTFPGIVVMTARGKMVAQLDDNGRPVEGSKDYRVEGHKSLGYDASIWVRMSREQAPVVVGARSVHAGIRPGVDKPQPVPSFTLEWLIFDLLKCDPRKAHTRDLIESKPQRTPEQIRDELVDKRTDFKRTRAIYGEIQEAGVADVALMNESGDEEALTAMAYRLGTERQAAEKSAQAERAEPAAANGHVKASA